MLSEQAGSSAYATSGGGVLFEHEFGWSMLVRLLLGHPVEGLGDEFTPTGVGLQQGAYSAVDDVMISGESPAGSRKLRVACRRRPVLGASSEPTVKLFVDFVNALASDAELIEAGDLRLGLAVAGPYGPASELATLTEIARGQPTYSLFASAVAVPRAYDKSVGRRLRNINELVSKALDRLDGTVTGADPEQLSWRLLRALYIVQVQLEGDTARDRTNDVARLQELTADVVAAAQLRLHLVDAASQAAIHSGMLTQSMT